MRAFLGALILCAACTHTGFEALAPESSAVPKGEWSALRVATHRTAMPTTWDGRLDGPVTFWHDNGIRAAEGAYVGGERDGPWTFWHENGRVRWRGTFEDGAVVGLERAWHDNGELQFEATRVDGELEGPYASWHENGRRESEGTYRAGEREGEFRAWHADGTVNVAETGWYRAGRKER
jgi:antitoxin component YwqK of YwqJK toxin-antitoxin module